LELYNKSFSCNSFSRISFYFWNLCFIIFLFDWNHGRFSYQLVLCPMLWNNYGFGLIWKNIIIIKPINILSEKMASEKKICKSSTNFCKPMPSVGWKLMNYKRLICDAIFLRKIVNNSLFYLICYLKLERNKTEQWKFYF
jgi:hypothetical protein